MHFTPSYETTDKIQNSNKKESPLPVNENIKANKKKTFFANKSLKPKKREKAF